MSLIEEILADRDRLLEEIYELRKFKSLAVDLIECQSGGRVGGRDDSYRGLSLFGHRRL
jgi:hypothetical protein